MTETSHDGSDVAGPGNHGSERGASLVEFAVVMPLLLFIMIAIVEVGVAIHDRFMVGSAVQDGVRVAAFQGNHPDADCTVLASVADFLGSDLANTDQVEIYQADANGNQVPGATNTYTPGGGDPADCDSWTKSITWPSTSRQVFVGTDPLDIVGVRIGYRRAWITGFPPFSGDLEIDESSISRLEPEGYR